MRIISMVPSWTETLLAAGLDVVGRTRYCLHPQDQVAKIPIVGGTKDIDWDLVYSLDADLILFDREENTLEMSEQCELPQLVTHVTSLESLQKELERLGDTFKNAFLIECALELYDILAKPNLKWDWNRIPAAEKTWGEQRGSIVYVIWKKPWMAVSRDTFIGSMLQKLGAQLQVFEDDSKYPVFEVSDHPNSFFLFSSEPYPFRQKEKELRNLGVSGALVNGELYSWYGVRALSLLRAEFAQHSFQGTRASYVQSSSS